MQILWTSDAEYALKKARADKYIMRITNQKNLDLLNGLIDQTVRELVPLDRTQIETMITIHVHQRLVSLYRNLFVMSLQGVFGSPPNTYRVHSVPYSESYCTGNFLRKCLFFFVFFSRLKFLYFKVQLHSLYATLQGPDSAITIVSQWSANGPSVT